MKKRPHEKESAEVRGRRGRKEARRLRATSLSVSYIQKTGDGPSPRASYRQAVLI